MSVYCFAVMKFALIILRLHMLHSAALPFGQNGHRISTNICHSAVKTLDYLMQISKKGRTPEHKIQ